MVKKKNDGLSVTDQMLGSDPIEPIPDGHKEYTVQRDGTTINGELLNQGDVVTLHPDDAAVLMNADVRLTEVPQAV